jgi:hypothetical protein
VIANWLGCGKTRIGDLRQWARNGFEKTPAERRLERADVRRAGQEPLKTNDNSTDAPEPATRTPAPPASPEPPEPPEVAEPDEVEDNVLYTLARQNEHAKAFKRIFKLSSFEHAAQVRIATAIDRMIENWRSTRAALMKTARNHDDG